MTKYYNCDVMVEFKLLAILDSATYQKKKWWDVGERIPLLRIIYLVINA